MVLQLVARGVGLVVAGGDGRVFLCGVGPVNRSSSSMPDGVVA
jgi:hypothetical protein